MVVYETRAIIPIEFAQILKLGYFLYFGLELKTNLLDVVGEVVREVYMLCSDSETSRMACEFLIMLYFISYDLISVLIQRETNHKFCEPLVVLLQSDYIIGRPTICKYLYF